MKAHELFPFDVSPLSLEREYWKSGLRLIAGVDEAGRGALAGPVVAAAVIASEECVPLLLKVKDSKKLSPESREELYPLIEAHAVAVAVGIVEADEIDRINILQASLLAMKIAVESLSVQPELCLIDGNMQAPLSLPQRTIVKGDDRVFSIAAASIIAKVTRDRLMRTLDEKHPDYGFLIHKGYGTELHRSVLERLGPCEQHRKSFSLPQRVL